MMAARLSPGAISESSSSHLPPSEASKTAKPVTDLMRPIRANQAVPFYSLTMRTCGQPT